MKPERPSADRSTALPDAGGAVDVDGLGGASGRPPRTWTLLAHRVGDNSQVLALAEALGWPYEAKRLAYRSLEMLVSWPFATTTVGIDRTRSDPLAAPWPELVLTSGRRNEPIARWIQAQAPHRVRRVHVGRPWERIEHWDLVVTTPQYRLPQVPNVLHNELPLHRIDLAALRREAAPWAAQRDALPRPRIAVLVGGSSGPYLFDPAAAEEMGRRLSAHARERGGSLLLTTSARTSDEATDALLGAIDVPLTAYRWRPNDPDNPYRAMLGCADEIVVTGDSMSMMSEACATGRPVYLYDFGRGRYAMRDETARAARTTTIREQFSRGWLKAFIYRTNMHYGSKRLSRDIRVIHRALVKSGRVAWLGDTTGSWDGAPLADVGRAVTRVRELFDMPPRESTTPRAPAAPSPRTSSPADAPPAAPPR